MIAEPATAAAVLDQLPVPLAFLSTADDPALLAVNGRFRASFGYDTTSLASLGRWLERTYSNPIYRQRILDQWQVAAASARAGGVGQLQCRLVSASGARPELLLQVSAIGGQLAVSFTDVSSRQRTEASLDDQQEERALTALAITEAIPVGTYTMVMRPDQPVAYFAFMSERFLEITGIDRERARANPLEAFACVHPEDYDHWLRLNAEAFAARRPFRGECRIMVRGEIRTVMAESVPRSLADGCTVWEGVLIDVTDRVQAQQRLEASERRLHRLLDHLPIPVIAVGKDGAASGLFHNRQFTASFGYTCGTLSDLATWLRRAYPDAESRRRASRRWRAALARARSSDGLVPADESRIHCADGSPRDVLISATLLDDSVVMALIDITERRRSEQTLASLRLREQQQAEEHRQRLEDKLRTSLTAAAVAHEINQPLSAILLSCKLALGRCRRGQPLTAPPEAEGNGLQPFLQHLVADAERVVGTIEKMRSLLRNVQTDHQPVDLVTVVESSLLGLQPEIRVRAVHVQTVGLQTSCWVTGDGDQLMVAVSNLLRNALEAMPAGRGRGRLRLTLEREQPLVRLCIDDNGCGLPADVLAALPLHTTKPDGSGIGLYVVQRALENHQGAMEFSASPLGGTRVCLHLPLPPPV